jgi:hypothetical protein
MSNDIVPAASIGLPKSNRRLFLVAGSAAACGATIRVRIRIAAGQNVPERCSVASS